MGEGVDATRCGGKADCQEGHMCLTHELWMPIFPSSIDGFLGQRISLASLMERDSHAHSVTLQNLIACHTAELIRPPLLTRTYS